MKNNSLKGTLWRSHNYSRDFIRIDDVISRGSESCEIMYTNIDGITYDKSNSTVYLKNMVDFGEFFQKLDKVDLEELKKLVDNTSNVLQELCSNFVNGTSENTYNEIRQGFIKKVKKFEGKAFKYKKDPNITLLVFTIYSDEIENDNLNDMIYFDRLVVGVVTKETTQKAFEELNIYTEHLENGNKYIYERCDDCMSYEFFINNFEECPHCEFEKCMVEADDLVLENCKTFYK